MKDWNAEPPEAPNSCTLTSVIVLGAIIKACDINGNVIASEKQEIN